MNRASHLDPRSPLVLDTHELTRRPGSMRVVRLTIPAPEELGTDVIRIPAGSDVELDLRLESVMEGVLVSGTVRGQAVGECVRCLDEVVDDVDIEVQELFTYSERAAIAAAEGEEDLRELDGDLIDVEPVLRDAVVPALPFQPLCQQDCPGLCSQCGARLADDPQHAHEIIDPRWAALGGLLAEPDDKKEH